ncbi:protocatechuate 3,4-dioxygenase [Robbsia andropogonis]|uniref:Protocatechuate 3,4-dioxygenase n=1 Tax=Robbsia andropogonis TaxID=28092 RepID=A0A0F5JXG8_9BURK|nr:protocatechuate 3,4-dioxygenase subunit alpha [Robbsia andropogonis]KKB62339.1 protocatechuate 3,4-dioxygenase [Robbsia andropogonis]MCP1119910.1 protocatechuate 3,4-dioxygenase subunit alpha [Robbsia andropogonis]MCP1129780.1 protocatechuate 3,4-dioxygenase subunit alpha [Robbsia andropogonis]
MTTTTQNATSAKHSTTSDHPLKQTPSQTVGPYFAYGLTPTQYNYGFESLFTPVIAQPEAKGEHITITGQVFDANGVPIADALLEFLQPNSEGRYIGTPQEAAETGFSGFGRVGTGTDPKARYTIDTLKPGVAVAGDAPHINVIVLMRGLLVHAFTRIYFDDEAAANSNDPVLSTVPAERRATLIAKREPISGKKTYRFDVRMQGDGETVFFDL